VPHRPCFKLCGINYLQRLCANPQKSA
jgi:hypothetical protein